MTTKVLKRLCATTEIDDQSAKRIRLEGMPDIAVCRVGDEFYAVADLCTHGLASLAEGEIEDGQIFCPFHGGAFDIKTGKPTERPCTIAVKTFPVQVRDGVVYLVEE